jgi:hypothetical protein
MKTRTRPRPGRCGRTVVLLMLTPLMLLNVSQAMTLCVRGHGDMALELVVQDRCACEISTPGASSSDSLASIASDGLDAGGWPCLDIPIPTSSCDRRVSLAADAQAPCLAGVRGPEPAMANSSCAMTRALRTIPASHAPLETILLQV